MTVLPRPYPQQMRNLFVRMGDEYAAARGEPSDPQEFRRRQALTRERLREALGLPLETCPLAAETTGVLERDSYRIEKVRYQSRPEFWVTAALYLPTGAPLPAPAVLNPHGHWERGRYHPEVQRRMIGLAKRGYVALSLDAVGFNEREAQGPHRTRNLFLVGKTVQGIQVWDNMRGIDYLCSRPEVDPTRIGCTGASGGGNQTMYVTALDERITASVPVCSVELGECYLHKDFCTCETVPGLFTFADLVDIAALAAPRALLLIHGMLDNGFLLDSAQKAARRLRERYRLAGAEERLGHFLSYDGHAYNREMREAVYAWFDRWLMGKTSDGATGRPGDGAMEEEGEPESDPATALAVFGQPVPGTGMLDLYRTIADRGVRGVDSGTTPRDRFDKVLVGPVSPPEGGVPGGWPARTPLRAHVVGEERVEVGGVAADRTQVYIFSEPDVVVPMVMLRPTGSPARGVTIHFSLDGKEAVPEVAIAADLAAGRAALLPDVRGTGETKQERRTPDAWLSSAVLGRPIHGMRAWDLRRAADWLYAGDDDDRPAGGNVTTPALRAHGDAGAGIVALLAAATDRRFASLEVEELLISYRNQPDFGPNRDWVIPRILEAGDIDDLVAMIAPRPVTVHRWVRADGVPMEVP